MTFRDIEVVRGYISLSCVIFISLDESEAPCMDLCTGNLLALLLGGGGT